ncbi:conjugal transfer protein [Martelella alba]|uniref:Conjugal transfer protein n=1 Tax=Martelella alba TaxID=2590451 RepID=A0A506U207_9HYPH|nr:TrbI/VirB10 family protein [Martelella alba]TPW27064.1 conjugal transfer protein [Martelella alba]
MTQEQDTSPETDAARMADAIDTAKKQRRGGQPKAAFKGRLLPAVVMIGLAAGFLVFVYWPKPEKTLATGSAEQFQTNNGDPFGLLARPQQQPAPAAEPDPELLEQIAALKAELEALRNQPKAEAPPAAEQQEDNGNDEKIEELLAQLTKLQATFDDAQKENRRALEERDRQLKIMQANLDAARLRGLNETPPDHSDEDLYQQRVNSPMVAYARSGNSETATGDSAAARMMSNNELFAREQAKPATVEKAKVIANPANTVMQGTMIQAALETAINTDLPGAIRAITTEDVHSFDGSRVLIPRGSHVVGAYSDDIVLGQRRVMIVWHRIIMPDNQTVNIGAYGGDAIGRSGASGKVDTHFTERFGSAALVSLITLAPALLIEDKGDNDKSSDIAAAMSQSLSGALGNTLSAYLNRKPTLGIDQGSEITIMVDRDLEIF